MLNVTSCTSKLCLITGSKEIWLAHFEWLGFWKGRPKPLFMGSILVGHVQYMCSISYGYVRDFAWHVRLYKSYCKYFKMQVHLGRVLCPDNQFYDFFPFFSSLQRCELKTILDVKYEVAALPASPTEPQCLYVVNTDSSTQYINISFCNRGHKTKFPVMLFFPDKSFSVSLQATPFYHAVIFKLYLLPFHAHVRPPYKKTWQHTHVTGREEGSPLFHLLLLTGACWRVLSMNHNSCPLPFLICPSVSPSLPAMSSCLFIRVRSSHSANQKSPLPPLPPPKTPDQGLPPPHGPPARRLIQKPKPCPRRAPVIAPSSTPWSPFLSRPPAPRLHHPPRSSPPFHASSTSLRRLCSSPRMSTRPLTPLPPLPLCHRSHRRAHRCPPHWARPCTKSRTPPPPPLPPLPPRPPLPGRTELAERLSRWRPPPARAAAAV